MAEQQKSCRALSRLALAILAAVALALVLGRALGELRVDEASAPLDLLDFDAETWAEQQTGGTWSEMFDRQALFNRYPGLAAILWWTAVTALGWLAFPILFTALPGLGDRGYGLARVLGLLLIAYLTWLSASLHVLPNTRGTILLMVSLLTLVGGGVGWFRRQALRDFVRGHWRLLLLIEGLFALSYVLWIGVRLLHPDLWHPFMGGEKPMIFAYLNAVIKSTWFPPYNPWFSGSWPNYYYFGSVIVGTLIKLTGTVPAIAYNLAVSLVFALTVVGAFSVGYNLLGERGRGALQAGVTASLFTAALGNLGVVRLLCGKLIELDGEPIPSTTPSFIQTVAALRGAFKVLFTDAQFPLSAGDASWYWYPTRIIPQESGYPITEFPAFTFLYGDLHVNMLALPLALLALTVIVSWAKASRPHWTSVLVGGLVMGAFFPAHTWDYPAYLTLALAGLAAGAWAWSRGAPWDWIEMFFWRAAPLIGLTVVLYFPYFQHYAAGYSSASWWEGSRTPADIYLWIHGVMLFPLLTYLSANVWRLRGRVSRKLWLAVPVGGAVVVLTLALDSLDYPVARVIVPVAALAALLILAPETPPERRLLGLMVGLAMAISLAVEAVVLAGDIGRMNTVFRFYQQVWLLLSIAAAVSLVRVRQSVLPRLGAGLQRLWWITMVSLIFGGALFLPFGIRARAVDRMSPEVGPTLDGMAFMAQGVVYDGPENATDAIPLSGDYAAIEWMQDNIAGSPVIMEGLGRHEYLWANRISVYTGLPAVVGWSWHQRQQRLGVMRGGTVEGRRADVDECYNTTSTFRAQEILARYGVCYIYVGAYERAYYDLAGLAKFDDMASQGLLRVIYDAQGTKIYEVEAER